VYGSPIVVTEDDFDRVGQVLADAMTGPAGQTADSR